MNRNSTLGEYRKFLCGPRPRGKEQRPHRRLNEAYWLCWRVPCGGVGQQWLSVGIGVLAAAVLEGAPWHKILLEVSINPTICP